MAKPLKIPLCLAITLGVCLSVITTDAIPNAASQDAIVPEEELSLIDATDLSHFTGLTQQPASKTLRAKVCEDGHICTFHIELDSTASDQDNEHLSGNDFEQMKVEFDFIVSPGTAKGTVDLSCKNFHRSDTHPATGKDNTVTDDKSHFQECLELSTRSVIQNSDGSLEMMVAEQSPNEIDRDDKCAGYTQEIQNIFAGTLEQLAGVYASADDESLIQFSETVQVLNNKRTTHYRREQHENGSMTVHRRHSWELEASKHPQPVLMQGGQQSITMDAKGHNTVDANGISTASKEKTINRLGAEPSKTGFSCTPSETPDADGKSCPTKDLPASMKEAHTVRIKNEANEQIKLASSEAAKGLVQKPTLNEFLQEHAAAGRFRIPLLKALRAKPEKQPVDPVNAEQDFAAFVDFLEQAKPSDFEPGQLRDEITRSMESPKMRRLTVDKLSKNEIKNGRAVQSLMHAIGRAGTQQVEAIDQLIDLGGSASVNGNARSQAIVALLQAKCYNHDYAIRRLAMLAKPNPQTHMQTMSLHVQHGLIGHAEHCANNKYTEASANKYDDILSQSRKHLADAAANKDDGATWILLDAIGNTNSQSPRETEAVASVANNDQLLAQTRLLAVRTLGRLYTDGALAALRKLSSSLDSEMQKAAEEAIAGKHLPVSDARKPPPGEVSTMSLAQSTGEKTESQNNYNIKAEKVWPWGGGDFRSEAKVGVQIFQDSQKQDEPLCLFGYGGADAKAWSYTVSLVQAGGLKCYGYKFYMYISILTVVVYWKQLAPPRPSYLKPLKDYNSNWKIDKNDNNGGADLPDSSKLTGKLDTKGFRPHPGASQLSTSSDRQGYCGTNVNDMDVVATVAYDRNFFNTRITLPVGGGFSIEGHVSLDGEVGTKVGWGNMGDTTINKLGDHWQEPACASGGQIAFSDAYAQATLKGELALSLGVAKGGGGVNVILAKLSAPTTVEMFSDGASCDGQFLKLESFGGKVYGFVDVITGWGWACSGWELRCSHWVATWSRAYEVILYQWNGPDWKTEPKLKCRGTQTNEAGVAEPLPTPYTVQDQSPWHRT